MPGFQDILGHETIKEHFKKAIAVHKVSHAYILAGEAGMGRKSLANAFALTLLCEKGQTEPCLECHACKQVLSGNHPDLSANYKIYIVDEAEKMTVQAQNALLKTIEEPPAYAVILLLTTNPDGFLPTILSRCVQLKLKPLPDSMIRGYLTEKMGVSESQSELYAAFARGNLGKAKRLAESEDFRQSYEQILNILKNIRQMDISQLLDAIKRLKDENMDLHECLDIMQVWYRDGLMFKVTKDANLLIFKDEFSAMNEMSTRIGYDGFENILNAIDKARIRLDANVNMELALELMFLAMKENS